MKIKKEKKFYITYAYTNVKTNLLRIVPKHNKKSPRFHKSIINTLYNKEGVTHGIVGF